MAGAANQEGQARRGRARRGPPSPEVLSFKPNTQKQKLGLCKAHLFLDVQQRGGI
jgi:hypothetical protein